MKTTFIIVFILGFYLNLRAQQNDSAIYMFCYFKNNGEDGLHLAYSKDAYTWTTLNNDRSTLKPTAGIDKLMRDPCIIKGGDGLYHMVFTVSWHEQGIGHATSRDLIHWSRQQYIPLMQHQNAKNCWAPEINYNAEKNEYFIYWASTIPGKFPETDTTGDGYDNHRMYYTTTKNFVTFTPCKLLYNKGFSTIDATIKKDNNGYIMFLKNETLKPMPQKNLHIAISKTIDGNYSEPSKPITGNYWAEGPTALKKDGKWMVYFDKYMDHKYGAVQSYDLVNWTDISEKIHMPEGLRHGTIFTVSKKEFQYVIEHLNQ